MALRHSELLQVAAELAGELAGAIVQKAWGPERRLVYLEVRQVGRSVLLCLGAQPALGRLSIARERVPSPPEPSFFQRRLRQELIGARLLEVHAAQDDRVVWLELEREGERRRLLAELKSPGGNLFLLDAAGRILAASDEALARKRELLAGSVYAAAPGELDPEARALPSRLAPAEGSAFPLAEAAEALHDAPVRARRVEELRRRLVAPLRARLAKLGRTIEKVEAEANRRAGAEEHRRHGELLSRNLHLVKRGARSVRLVDYTEAGPLEVELALDPSRSPKDEAEWHFHQYRRLLRGSEAAARRQEELARERASLERQLREAEAITAEELLARPVAELPTPAERRGEARPYKEYLGARGQRILVGKGSAANDALTFKVARPQDLWLHARGVSGAHVVVPLERGAELPQELLLDAAHLALHHSGAKGEPRGEVSYTHAKFVRKQKGGAPGQVTYSRERSFVVRVEPERLERLLRTRGGDDPGAG